MTGISESTSGSFSSVIFIGITSSRGTRLNGLGIVTGQRSLIPTKAQRIHGNHFGAFLEKARIRITASMIHVAAMLRFSKRINN